MATKHTAEEFTATRFNTAEDKARFVNALLAFVDAGFPEAKFTKTVYDGLYLHCFGHIAHYDRGGFYGEWFATDEERRRWMEYAVAGGAYGTLSYGDPSVTWCDVEKVVQEEMRARLGVLPGF